MIVIVVIRVHVMSCLCVVLVLTSSSLFVFVLVCLAYQSRVRPSIALEACGCPPGNTLGGPRGSHVPDMTSVMIT